MNLYDPTPVKRSNVLKSQWDRRGTAHCTGAKETGSSGIPAIPVLAARAARSIESSGSGRCSVNAPTWGQPGCHLYNRPRTSALRERGTRKEHWRGGFVPGRLASHCAHEEDNMPLISQPAGAGRARFGDSAEAQGPMAAPVASLSPSYEPKGVVTKVGACDKACSFHS